MDDVKQGCPNQSDKGLNPAGFSVLLSGVPGESSCLHYKNRNLCWAVDLVGQGWTLLSHREKERKREREKEKVRVITGKGT